MVPLNHVPPITGAASRLRDALKAVPGGMEAFEAYSREVTRSVGAMQDRLTSLEAQVQALRKAQADARAPEPARMPQGLEPHQARWQQIVRLPEAAPQLQPAPPPSVPAALPAVESPSGKAL
jgi:hypothetical protein